MKSIRLIFFFGANSNFHDCTNKYNRRSKAIALASAAEFPVSFPSRHYIFQSHAVYRFAVAAAARIAVALSLLTLVAEIPWLFYEKLNQTVTFFFFPLQNSFCCWEQLLSPTFPMHLGNVVCDVTNGHDHQHYRVVVGWRVNSLF